MTHENEDIMPILLHLKELRKRLFFSLIALAIGFSIAMGYYDYIIEFLFEPFMQLSGNKTSDEVLFVNTIAEGLIVQLKVSVFAGLIISSPIHIYNIIRFILPGLLKREKQILATTLLCSFVLVIGSFYYTYYTIIPISIAFLTGHGFIPENTGLLLNFSSNIFYILQFIFMAVIVFQLPVILELLMILNVIQRKTLLGLGKYLVVLFFFVAAILSPPDFVTQIGLALPMTVLFYLTLLIAKIFKFGEE